MNANHNMFSNYYRIMEYIYSNQITINNVTFAPVTQTDIATYMKCDRMTVNKIIAQMKEDGMLIQSKKKTKQYQLTNEANRIIRAIKRI